MRASFLVCLLLIACSVHHAPPASAVFRIESREGALHLVPPALPGGVAVPAISFPQIIPSQYGYNPWEQYVDLSQGMRLAVLRMTGQTQTASSYYGITGAGRRGFRMRNLTPESEAFDKHAKYLRLFYQTKFMKSPGQPVRPALFLWGNSMERLGARTAEARENPTFSCDGPATGCLAFPGKTTVSPEIQIVVNQKPRYILLGSTVRDLLRTDRVSDSADIRLLRKYRDHMIPVTWQQRADVMPLPLVGGDEMSW